MNVTIRPELEADRDAIRQIHRLAFEGEGEAKLVDDLHEYQDVEVSLVAVVEDAVVGHILFSRLRIETEQGEVPALSLAPMAVLPDWQRRGIGQRLVEAGLEACRERGQGIVTVLGHPDYYPRFGFSADLASGLQSPFGGGEAWMAVDLGNGEPQKLSGQVRFPRPFLLLVEGHETT